MSVRDREYTLLSDREIAGTGLGSSPAAVAAFGDLQRAVYTDQPADTAAAQEAAAQAQGAAAGAQSSADNAQASADNAGNAANAAQQRADAAYALADTKVTKDAGPAFSAPVGTVSRAALPAYTSGTAGTTYTQADMQAAMDQIAALTSRVAALITDLRANHALKN